MKRILSLLSIILVCNSLFCQDQEIPKKANTIIISGTFSRDEYFRKINDLLFENGYGIQNADRDLGNITTTDKSFKHGILRLTLLIKDNSVLIRGQFNMNISYSSGPYTNSTDWTVIQYLGMPKSPSMVAWSEMNKIADAINGNKSYSVR